MNEQLMHSLLLRETDVSGVLRRFNNDENLYITCLEAFLSDTTVSQLNEAVASRSWDEAFTAAHAIKGLAGNMGFVPLMHLTGKLVILIRGGRTAEIAECMEQVNSCYRDISGAIRDNLPLHNKKGEHNEQ